MTALTLDGKAAAAQIKAELTERVAALRARGVTPGIATVLVGADPASQLYVGMKHRQSEEIGMNSIQRELPADATQAQVVALIDELGAAGPKVLDASTAFRVAPDWVYGFAELAPAW